VPNVKKFASAHLEQQAGVNAYFQSQSLFWKDIYASSDVYAEIHQERHATVLSWVDSLALSPGSQVLEIGCGAGLMAVALVQRGFRVHAIDSVEAMVELARQHAADARIADMLTVDIGDSYALAFEDGSFDLVLAIGVIPWIGRVEPVMQEMARVTKPGGQVILTADNRARLNNLLDPWLNPMIVPLKHFVKDTLEWSRLRHRSLKDIGATSHGCRFIDRSLAHAGLVKTRGKTLGFGPFSLFRRSMLSQPLSIVLHHRLQRLADRGVPVFRSTGAQYIVLAAKPAPSSPMQL
jgi:ubiquinone/menaquinone biosynthesis C-methylase UbiE